MAGTPICSNILLTKRIFILFRWCKHRLQQQPFVLLEPLPASVIAGREVAHSSDKCQGDTSDQSGSDEDRLIHEPDKEVYQVNWRANGTMAFDAYANHCLPTRLRMSTTQQGLAPDWKAPFVHVILLPYFIMF